MRLGKGKGCVSRFGLQDYRLSLYGGAIMTFSLPVRSCLCVVCAQCWQGDWCSAGCPDPGSQQAPFREREEEKVVEKEGRSWANKVLNRHENMNMKHTSPLAAWNE